MEATITPETANALQKRALENQESVAAATCTPYIMLYARGTTESGELGLTVGPALKAGLMTDKNWSVIGIGPRDGYDASLAGIYCIGMPGGMACKDILEKKVAECPDSKFVASGYSQGAMVARICVAYASEEAKAKVIGVCSAPTMCFWRRQLLTCSYRFLLTVIHSMARLSRALTRARSRSTATLPMVFARVISPSVSVTCRILLVPELRGSNRWRRQHSLVTVYPLL